MGLPVRLPRVAAPAHEASAVSARVGSPVVLLAGMVAGSGVLLLVLGSMLTFLLDDWTFLLYRPGWSTDAVLNPHNEHIVVLPVLIYKGLLSTFGMDSAFPFRVVSTLVFLLSAVLLFAWLRRRIGDWLALIGATLILFLGAAWEDLLWPFQIGFFGTMACGLGMLLALQREDRIGDRLACGLLTVSIAFSSLGLSFAAGAAVDVYQRRDRWRSRIYLIAVPLLLYGLWWIGWGHKADTHLSLHNFATTFRFVLDAVAAGMASLFGLATPTPETAVGGLDWGRPIMVTALLFAGWRLHRLSSIPRWLWVVAAIGASFWALGGLNVIAGRGPTVSRYQYPSAIFIMLIAAELLRGIRIGRRTLIAVSVLATASVASNIAFLHDSYKSYKLTSDLERGRSRGSRDHAPHRGSRLHPQRGHSRHRLCERAGRRVSLSSRRLRLPAYTPEELIKAPEPPRVAADKVLAAALRIKLFLQRGTPAGRGAPPK